MPRAAAAHRHAPPQSSSFSHRRSLLLLFFLKCIIMLAVVSIFLFFLGFAALVLLHFLLLSSRRLSPAGQSLLPAVSYTAQSSPFYSDCAICLDGFKEGDECATIPGCKHFFHSRCVDRWIRRRPTCPVCRNRVDLDRAGVSGSGPGGGEDRWKRLWVVNFDEGGASSY